MKPQPNSRITKVLSVPHMAVRQIDKLNRHRIGERGKRALEGFRQYRDSIGVRSWNIQRGVEPQSSTVSCLTNPTACGSEASTKRLKLLSFNIQVGIETHRYRHYITRGWKHFLPHEARQNNLREIADVVGDFDLVALQEIDVGSIRSGFVNQVEYLAAEASFPYWYSQRNRNLGPIAQHGNGLLSRVEPHLLEDHKLPGTLPGRGAIVMKFCFGETEVMVVLLHLSLGKRSQETQLEYVRDLLEEHPHAVVMGDMNSHLNRLLFDSPLADTSLRPAEDVQPTYPSWQPAVALDHVLVSPGLEIENYEVLDCRLSDHRPIAVSIGLRQENSPRLQ